MARSFDGSTQYFAATGAPVSDMYGVAISLWYYCTSNTTVSEVAGMSYVATGARVAIQIVGTITNDPIRAFTSNGGSSSNSPYNNPPYNAWVHVVANFGGTATMANRQIFVNTNASTIQTSDRGAVSAPDAVQISSPSATDGMHGYIAELGIYNKTLSTAEIAMLAAGYAPICVAANDLAFYAPLHGRGGATSDEQDWVGGLTLTQTGDPGVVDHPRIIYPRRRTSIWVPPVSSGAPSITALSAIGITATSAQPRISYS